MHQIVLFSGFLRAPNRAFFGFSSCTKSCFFLNVLRAPNRAFFLVFFVHQIVLFCGFLRAPHGALLRATVTEVRQDTTPLHTELLHTEAFTHRSLFTEQLLHTEAFTQREAFAQSSFYNLICAETLNTQMPKLLHRQVFTQRHLHKNSSHRCGRCFYTQKLLNTDAFTHRSIYPEML